MLDEQDKILLNMAYKEIEFCKLLQKEFNNEQNGHKKQTLDNKEQNLKQDN